MSSRRFGTAEARKSWNREAHALLGGTTGRHSPSAGSGVKVRAVLMHQSPAPPSPRSGRS